jgi:hypothetical protein
MNTTNRSRVIRLAEAQLGIPGPAGEHAVLVLQHGTLDVKLSFPECPNQQTPHEQDEVYAEVSYFTTVSGIHSSQATFSSWLREPSIGSRTLPRTSPCGGYSTARAAARFQHRVW